MSLRQRLTCFALVIAAASVVPLVSGAAAVAQFRVESLGSLYGSYPTDGRFIAYSPAQGRLRVIDDRGTVRDFPIPTACQVFALDVPRALLGCTDPARYGLIPRLLDIGTGGLRELPAAPLGSSADLTGQGYVEWDAYGRIGRQWLGGYYPDSAGKGSVPVYLDWRTGRRVPGWTLRTQVRNRNLDSRSLELPPRTPCPNAPSTGVRTDGQWAIVQKEGAQQPIRLVPCRGTKPPIKLAIRANDYYAVLASRFGVTWTNRCSRLAIASTKTRKRVLVRVKIALNCPPLSATRRFVYLRTGTAQAPGLARIALR